MEADSAAVGRYKPRGILRVLRALVASANGLAGAFREEAAFRQELALAAFVIPLALWLGHSGVERALLIAPMLLILIVELLNSAIEATVDRIGHPVTTIEFGASRLRHDHAIEGVDLAGLGRAAKGERNHRVR